MSATPSNVDGDRGWIVFPGTDGELEHTLVERDDGRTECTVFPRDCDDEEIVTRWITAHEGSFVSLDSQR